MVGLTADGSSGILLSGITWAQICGKYFRHLFPHFSCPRVTKYNSAFVLASQWLHMMIWSFGHAWAVEVFGFVLMPFFAAFFLLASITGGWNTDLADPGYKAFFQIFPFNWSINVMRYVVFKSCRTKVLSSALVLCAYWLTVYVGYIRSALKNELVKVSDKSLMKSKYSAPPPNRGNGTLLLRNSLKHRKMRSMMRDFTLWGSNSNSPKRFNMTMHDERVYEEVTVAEPNIQDDDHYVVEEEEKEETEDIMKTTASMKPVGADEV